MKHDRPPPPSLPGDAAALGVDLSPGAVSQLADFERLLLERAIPLGIVAASDASRVRDRHVLDSLRAAVCVRAGDRLAYDMGSGAGLPGIVVAVARPELTLRLVEPRRARIAFLELAIERLGLANAEVVQARIEDVLEPADLCFARALASLSAAWLAAMPRLRPGGRLVYYAGALAKPPEVLDGASSVEVVKTPVLERAGSLIIMTR